MIRLALRLALEAITLAIFAAVLIGWAAYLEGILR